MAKYREFQEEFNALLNTLREQKQKAEYDPFARSNTDLL